jgi:hypothetical protein
MLAFLEGFYRDTLALVFARQVNARAVTPYDANNAYQQVLGRQDVHLQWLEAAIAQLGGSAPPAPGASGESAAGSRKEKPDQRALLESDVATQHRFVEGWERKVALVSNARHRKMLELILGEMREHLRVFQQALDGRTDVLGRHADGKVLSGKVLPARPTG